MAIKEKILSALEIAFEDLSLERLIDILLYAYNDKKRRIEELNAENARERGRIYDERERMKCEYKRMREDPLYCSAGYFYFATDDGRVFSVFIQGQSIRMNEVTKNQINVPIRQLTLGEFSDALVR